MAHPFEMLMSGALKLGKGAWKVGTAGAVAKTAIGAGVGGVAGAAGGYDFNSRIEGAAKGALLGGAAGAAVGFGPKALFGTRIPYSPRNIKDLAMQRGAKFMPGRGIGTTQKDFDAAMQSIRAEGIKIPGMVSMAWGGTKSLFGMNRAAQKSAILSKIRAADMGSATAQGPLTQGASQAAQNALKANTITSRIAASPGGRAAGLGARAIKAAADNPMAVLGIGAGIVGTGMLAGSIGSSTGKVQPDSSPGMSGGGMRISYDQQQMMTAQLGPVGAGRYGGSDMMRGEFDYAQWMANTGRYVATHSRLGRFADSTVGLPQGLHAGRHG